MIKVMFRRVLSFLRRNVSLLQVFTVAVSAVFFNYCAQSETPLEEPEITVSPLMPSRTTAEKGGDVKLSAVITNNKEEAAENIMVKYYFLSAPELPTPEMPSEAVGSQTIPFLASGGAVSLRFDISTPETPGSYYYYVCIGDGFGNCAGPVSLNVVDTLERSVGTPDLIVDTPLLTRSVLLTEGLFTLSAIVRNQGSGTSLATTLQYYSSPEEPVPPISAAAGTAEGAAIGITSLSGAAADLIGGADSSRIDLNAPSSEGTYYYFACVESVTGESGDSAENNCSLAVQITVSAPPPEPPTDTAPDLVIKEFSASLSGQDVQLTAIVENRGDETAPATNLYFYESADDVRSDNERIADSSQTISELAANTAIGSAAAFSKAREIGQRYYFACVDSVTGETVTDNNCSMAKEIPATPADLQVTIVSPPPSLEESSTFTLTYSLTNAGGTDYANPGSDSTVVYKSDNDDGTGKTELSGIGMTIPNISAVSGASDNQMTGSITQGSAGETYYYFVCAKTSAAENCSIGVGITSVAAGTPILAPVIIDADPTSLVPGGTIGLDYTVSNSGQADAASIALKFYRADTSGSALSPNEPAFNLASGAAPKTGNVSFTTDSALAAGSHDYFICIESYSYTGGTGTKICSAAFPVSFVRPDLYFYDLSAPNEVEVGNGFTLSAKLKNQGASQAAASTVTYRRSNDSTIDSSDDLAVAMQMPVEALDPNGEQMLSPQITVPADLTPKTYWFGACVSTVAGERVTDNNCSSGVRVKVTSEPRLTLSLPTLSGSAIIQGTPASITQGVSFQMSYTVSNTGGTAAATSIMLEYYRSTDSTIDGSDSDTKEGDSTLTTVMRGAASASRDVNLTAQSTPNDYWYGVCIVSYEYNSMSVTTPICSTGIQLRVTGRPDLQIAVPTAPSSVLEGVSFTLGFTVQNTGNKAHILQNDKFLHIYRRDMVDSNDPAQATEINTANRTAIPALAASNGSSSQTASITQAAAGKTYYYFVCADAVADESVTNNNCSATAAVVSNAATRPDLQIAVPTAPSDVNEGASFTLSFTVQNTGSKEHALQNDKFLRIYRAASDTNVPADAAEINTGNRTAIPALAASTGSSSQTASITQAVGGMTHYYFVCADAVADESVITNNCSAAVGVISNGKPDLQITPPTAPSDVNEGVSFTLNYSVRNIGTKAHVAVTDKNLHIYRATSNTNDPIDATVTEIDRTEIPALAASTGSSNQTPSITQARGGVTYHYFVCADAVAGESVTNNNCSATKAVISNGKPDLAIFGPNDGSDPIRVESIVEKSPIFISVVIKNIGSINAGRSRLTIRRSMDSTITTTSHPVGQLTYDSLDRRVEGYAFAGNGTDTSLDVSTETTIYYGVCVEVLEGTADSNPDNNCSDASAVRVRNSGPDLTLSQNNGANYFSPSALEVGAAISTTLLISNIGNENAAISTLSFYRSTSSAPATLYATASRFVSLSIPAANVTARSQARLGDVSLGAMNLSVGTYYFGACIAMDSGTDIDSTNNCTVPQRIMVSSIRFDLSLESLSVSPTTIDRGATATLSVTLRNSGPSAAPSGAAFSFYRSTDSTITTGDTAINQLSLTGSISSGSTHPSGDRTSAPVPLNLKPGNYWYGACIDSQSQDTNTANDCTAGVQITVPTTSGTQCQENLPYWIGDSCIDGIGEFRGVNSYVFTVRDVSTITITSRNAGEQAVMRSGNYLGPTYISGTFTSYSTLGETVEPISGPDQYTLQYRRNNDGSVTITQLPSAFF